jgi:dihydrofolate reductase
MRKLIVSNIISLDGFYEGPGGEITALPMDDSFDAYNVERLIAADALLLGRKSYEMLRGFWPSVVDHPDASPAEREVSRLENAIEKFVVSNSLATDPEDPWHETTSVVRTADARADVAELKQRPGMDVLVFGSRRLWNELLRANLVDELHLMIGPVIVGKGTPAFDEGVIPRLTLLGSRTFDRSDNFVVRYAVQPM